MRAMRWISSSVHIPSQTRTACRMVSTGSL